jgi:dTDP-4-dehydrorhamnose reductase
MGGAVPVRMLVTGAKGAVGSYAPQVFGDKYDLILVDKDELDVREPDDCRWIRAQKPDVVLHLAAATDVDECERSPELAWSVNTLGTGNVALASLNTRFVYVSTAGVFSGRKHSPYTELDPAIPANVYGRAKLQGERLVQKMHPDYLIVRSGWMFGGGNDLDRKFVGKIQNQIAAGYNEIWAVDDKIGSPTYAKDLLYTIDRLLDAEETGVFHGCNQGVCTRFDVAEAIVDLTGADAVVRRASSDAFKLDAPRARSEAMDCHRLRVREVPASRPWREALAEYLA